jgi:hypothetical protein
VDGIMTLAIVFQVSALIIVALRSWLRVRDEKTV